MKTTLIIITIIILLAAGLTACTNEPEKITEVILMNDITDPRLAQPDTNEILNLFDLDNQWNGAIFRYMNVTDVSFNNIKETRINPQNKWFGNEFDRKKEIKKFKKEVIDILSVAKDNSNNTKDNSSIYFPLAKELNNLQNITANKKVLILFSDLMENTETLSFYKKNDFEKLKSNPEQIKEIFEKQITLDSLNGIEVYIIYQPANNNNDQKFQIISEFYKKLLENKGAKVNISANL